MTRSLHRIIRPLQRNTHRIGWDIVAITGYILSPLSAWNDLYVNVPLAYLSATILNTLLGINKLAGFYIGYTLTNVAGLLMLALGAQAAREKVLTRRQVLRYTIVSTLYAVAASALLSFLGLL